MAEDGSKNGFWIHIGTEITLGDKKTVYNPISREYDVAKRTEWKQGRYYYQGQLTTEEYNQFATFRGKMLKEQDVEKQEDMSTRLYEYGAMKFLNMDHDTYVRARKDEIRMAVDSCLHISSWNGQIGNNPTIPIPNLELTAEYISPTKPKNQYYSSPDEQE